MKDEEWGERREERGQVRRLICLFHNVFDKYSFSSYTQPEGILGVGNTEIAKRVMNLGLMKLAFCSGSTDVSRPSESNSSDKMPKKKRVGPES